MTFKELFNKMGINMDGEVTTPNQEPTTPPKPPTDDKTTSTANDSSTVEQQDLTKQLAAQKKEIEDLKAANLALLKQTPVQSKEHLSVEDMIYRSVFGEPEKTTNKKGD